MALGRDDRVQKSREAFVYVGLAEGHCNHPALPGLLQKPAFAKNAPVMARCRLGHVRQSCRAIEVFALIESSYDFQADGVAEGAKDVGEGEVFGVRVDKLHTSSIVDEYDSSIFFEMRRVCPIAAYISIDMTPTDPAAIALYEQNVGPILAQYGGELIARDEKPIYAEGDRKPSLAVIIRFDNKEAFRRFYDSAEYTPWREFRMAHAQESAVVIEGIDAA